MSTLDRTIAPKFNEIDTVNFLQPKHTKLANGIEINAISGGSQQIIRIDFLFDAGIWQQPSPLIAGATNDLIKEGTQNYSAQEIAENIDQYGAFLETEVNYDGAKITLYTLTKYLNKVLPFFKEVILYPKLSEKEFTIYRNNKLEKFKINLEKVSFLARKQFMASVFGNECAYGSNPSIANYKALSLEEIQAFHKKYYNLNNCQILVSGKIDQEVIEQINASFGKEALDEKKVLQQKILSNLPNGGKTEPIFIEKEKALQSAIRIGRLIPNKTHQDYYSLQVLNTVLGGYFGSRLMKNIREDKGYTYGIGSGMVSLQNSGYFFISTEVGSAVTKDALKEIYGEMERLREEKVKPEELELVKNYLLGTFLKSCDGPFNMGSLFENVHLYGLDYGFYRNYIKAIKETTSEELLKMAQKYFNIPDMIEVVVGKK